MSPARARLLKALLDQSPAAQLFAVGDDWQAIYRFGGSDIAIMREFAERFGDTKRMDLETTFRCAEPIAAVATRFVLANPAQIRKTVHSTRQLQGPCVHVGLSRGRDQSLLREALSRIAVHAANHEEPSNVLLLGRYKHLRPGNLAGLAKQHPRLQLSFKTVHGSKGLQADYVVVLGLCTGRHGFPTEITDDPLLDLVLSAPEEHSNAEERRLFYVAPTRARRHVFVLADGGPPSPFVVELIGGNYDVAVFGQLPGKDVPCPTCVNGHLVHRESAHGKGAFYGCSNWPYCEHRQPPCPSCGRGLPVKAKGGFRCRDCGQQIEACPSCGGWLRTRTGKYGRFLGCSSWPACDYTRADAARQRKRGRDPGPKLRR
ncbi:MAG: topoisomerase DNA-binding C4 zinc finger domain-containing protein [Bryobacterales bacterium]|nr:topoisomerase DNA-binding C4 zinc finger domain-containing protein [Bryobacterales bacterium]